MHKEYKSLSDTVSDPSTLQSDELNEAEVIESPETPSNEGNTVKRRRQTTVKPKAAPVERPRRSIRPVVPYGSEATESKARNKKPIEISQGSGLSLSQIPHVLRAIDKMKTSDDVLKGLHKLIYGRMGSKHDIKNHIRAFSGFKIQTPLDEIVLKEKLEKWKIAGLKDICHLFGLKSSGDKQKIVDRVYDFLKNPRDMTAPNEENGKGKGGKKKKSATIKAKTIIIRKKTGRDMFYAVQRSVYKEKEENLSKTRTEIDSLLAEAWKGLSEEDKKSYSEKATDTNMTEPQQKRQNQNKNKAKQPEMVEDSDLSEEEFEDLVTNEDEQKEQPKDADVVDSDSDLSDPPSDDENDDAAVEEKQENSRLMTMEVNLELTQSSRKRGAVELEAKEGPQKRQRSVASAASRRGRGRHL
ncbi:5953_t:CDS:2, partial [Funneliformis geosporum]